MLRDLVILSMSSLLKWIAEKLLSELRTTNLGNKLSFVTGVHLEAKSSLKSLAFSLKSVTSLLAIFNSGINGIFYHLKKVFKIDQYVLELVDGLINF